MSIPPNSLYDFGPQAPGVLSAPRLAAAPGPAPTGPVNPAVAGIHVPLWLLGALAAWFVFLKPGGRRRNPGRRVRAMRRRMRRDWYEGVASGGEPHRQAIRSLRARGGRDRASANYYLGRHERRHRGQTAELREQQRRGSYRIFNPARWDYEYGPRYESAEDFRGGGWGAWDKLNQRFVGSSRLTRGDAYRKVMRLRRGERLPARYRNPGERRRSRRAATAAFQRRLFLFDKGKPRRAPAEDARNRRQRHRERGFEARAYRADREAGF